MYVGMYECIYVRVCMYVHVHVNVCIDVCICVDMYIHIPMNATTPGAYPFPLSCLLIPLLKEYVTHNPLQNLQKYVRKNVVPLRGALSEQARALCGSFRQECDAFCRLPLLQLVNTTLNPATAAVPRCTLNLWRLRVPAGSVLDLLQTLEIPLPSGPEFLLREVLHLHNRGEWVGKSDALSGFFHFNTACLPGM